MINTRKIGGGYYSPRHTERRQGALILFPLRLPKGGQRWDNTSDKGGVIYG